jgi:hypothetical protein
MACILVMLAMSRISDRPFRANNNIRDSNRTGSAAHVVGIAFAAYGKCRADVCFWQHHTLAS